MVECQLRNFEKDPLSGSLQLKLFVNNRRQFLNPVEILVRQRLRLILVNVVLEARPQAPQIVLQVTSETYCNFHYL